VVSTVSTRNRPICAPSAVSPALLHSIPLFHYMKCTQLSTHLFSYSVLLTKCANVSGSIVLSSFIAYKLTRCLNLSRTVIVSEARPGSPMYVRGVTGKT
jgi:hypothetical protein